MINLMARYRVDVRLGDEDYTLVPGVEYVVNNSDDLLLAIRKDYPNVVQIDIRHIDHYYRPVKASILNLN